MNNVLKAVNAFRKFQREAGGEVTHQVLMPHRGRFPGTATRNLPGRQRALRLRRAKNKVARASRKVNR